MIVRFQSNRFLCLMKGWRVHENSIWSGLEQTFVAGRFHIIPKAIKLGCGDLTLVLDGGEHYCPHGFG